MEHIWPQSTCMCCICSGIYYASFHEIFSSAAAHFINNIFLSAGYLHTCVWHVGLQEYGGHISPGLSVTTFTQEYLCKLKFIVRFQEIFAGLWRVRVRSNRTISSSFLGSIELFLLSSLRRRRMCVTWPRRNTLMKTRMRGSNNIISWLMLSDLPLSDY